MDRLRLVATTWSQSLSRLVTNLLAFAVKLVGLVSATNQLLVQPHPSAAALGLSAFLVGGAQISQNLVLAVLDRLLGAPPEHARQPE